MKRISVGSSFPMDRGIEKIVRSAGAGVETGPAAEISPAFSPIRPRLELLYAQPNLEDYMAGQLSPAINEAALLLPNRFNAALHGAMEGLREAAGTDPRNARVLTRAARLMSDQVALRDLAHMYRSALLKG